MDKFDLYGIGSALVDILIPIEDSELQELGFKKSSVNLIDKEEQDKLIEKFADRDPQLVSGGSIANSLITFAMLGGKSIFTTLLGDDSYGFHYKSEMDDFSVDLTHSMIVGGHTGKVAVFITPDSERTMRTYLGINLHLEPKHISEDIVKRSKWIVLEGYILSQGKKGFDIIMRAISFAKEHAVKVAFSLSDSWIVNSFREELDEILPAVNLVFGNRDEAVALTGEEDLEQSMIKVKQIAPNIIITDGKNGCYVRYNGVFCHTPAFDINPVDLTGAGDTFCGTFLYGLINGYDVKTSSVAANYLAGKVIEKVGARLSPEVKEYWKEAMLLAEKLSV